MSFLGSIFEHVFWTLEEPLNNKGCKHLVSTKGVLSRVSIEKFLKVFWGY